MTGFEQVPPGPPFDPDAMPVEAALTRDRATIRFTWRDGAQAALSASLLRSHCRCAWCTRDRVLGCFPVGFEGITVKHLEPMGGYAVHLAFSDEHARGIFPWAYLRDLAIEAADPEQPAVRHPAEAA